MTIGLKINEQHTLVKHNISNIVLLGNEMHIDMNSGQCFILFRSGEFDLERMEYELEAVHVELASTAYASVQQQLSEYLGIEVHDNPAL